MSNQNTSDSTRSSYQKRKLKKYWGIFLLDKDNFILMVLKIRTCTLTFWPRTFTLGSKNWIDEEERDFIFQEDGVICHTDGYAKWWKETITSRFHKNITFLAKQYLVDIISIFPCSNFKILQVLFTAGIAGLHIKVEYQINISLIWACM